ncbi:MAG: hypothetical protein KBT50_02945 [Cycloclasticus sp.]|nr:hypothetical protein [Cycloclasticus sp.]MBQ0789549.1 hypothetical protein [Cycloclasticus sp.]
MKNHLIVITLISLFLLANFQAHAVDIENGRSLHAENCLACHGVDIYQQDKRKLHDLAALTAQVKRCDFSLGTQWFDEDIEDAVSYLNNEFYHFK